MALQVREGIRRFKERLGFVKREIPTFGMESLREYNGRHRLHIKLAKTSFLLPLVHLNFPEVEEAAIGWFDPNPKVNPGIDKAATKVMGEMLRKMKPKVVIMTNSTKSEHFIQEAMKKSPRGTRLIILPSGSEEEKGIEIEERSAGQLIEYTPVTGTKKLMGYPKPVDGQRDYLTLDELKVSCPNGEGLVIADDVYTTGETMKAMEMTLGLGEKSEHKVVVIAIERQYDGQYREKLIPKNVHAAFNLTEFLELDRLGIERRKLHDYNKQTIPFAIVESSKQ